MMVNLSLITGDIKKISAKINNVLHKLVKQIFTSFSTCMNLEPIENIGLEKSTV